MIRLNRPTAFCAINRRWYPIRHSHSARPTENQKAMLPRGRKAYSYSAQSIFFRLVDMLAPAVTKRDCFTLRHPETTTPIHATTQLRGPDTTGTRGRIPSCATAAVCATMLNIIA